MSDKLSKYPKDFQKWLYSHLNEIYKEYQSATSSDYQKIAEEYNNKIHSIRKKNNKFYISDRAKNKIKKCLKDFSEDELIQAINNFSQDEWWMNNNSHRGLAWFFNTPDRIEQFLNLQKNEDDPSIKKLKNILKNER